MSTKKESAIPGVSFSLQRALGISSLKNKISRNVGIPLTKSGRQRKYGRWLDTEFEEKEPEAKIESFRYFIEQMGAGAAAGVPVNHTGSGVVATGDDTSVVPVNKRKRNKMKLLKRVSSPSY
jgi:hypothetical protein